MTFIKRIYQNIAANSRVGLFIVLISSLLLFYSQAYYYKLFFTTNEYWWVYCCGAILALSAGASMISSSFKCFNTFFAMKNVSTKVLMTLLLLSTVMFFNPPLCCGPVILIAAVWIPRQVKIRSTLIIVSIIATLSAIYFIVTYSLSSSHHAAMWISYLLSPLFMIFGIENTIVDNYIQINYNGTLYQYAVSYEQSGFWIMSFLIVLCIIMLLIFRQRWSKIALAVFMGGLYFVFRYAVMIYIYAFENSIDVFFSLPITLISYVPYCAIFPMILDVSEKSDSCKKPKEFCTSRFVIIPASFLAMAISATILAVILPLGEKKEGIVYIDEYHSDAWESVYQPLNTEEFGGQKTSYTYYSFVELLKTKYKVEIITSSEQYTQLKYDDILIVKTPTIPFSEDEHDIIDNFVRQGGGLWVIGDHTNLFNMNTHLNSITKHFGIEFQYDAVYDLETTGLTKYDNPYHFFRSSISEELDGYEFATGCSIKSAIGTAKVIVENNACAEMWDLSHQNFFGDLSLSEKEYFGLFEMCVARKIQRGRVVAFADSTTLSSFSVYMHKNPEFVFSTMDFLNHANSFNWLYVCAIIMFTAFIGSVIIYRRQITATPFFLYFIVITFIAVGFSGMIISLDSKSRASRISAELNDLQTVFFINSDDDSLSSFIGTANPGDYSSFFMSFQRKGYFVREKQNIRNCFERNSNTIVLLEPDELTHQDIHELSHYAEKHGGKVVFCMSLSDISTKDNLAHLGIEYLITAQTEEVVYSDSKNLLSVNKYYFPITRTNRTYISTAYSNIRVDEFTMGNHGEFYVLFFLETFDNIMISEPGTAPTEKQKELFEELFLIIDFIQSN